MIALAISAALVEDGYPTRKAQAEFLGVLESSWSKYCLGKDVQASTVAGWLATSTAKGRRLALWWTATGVKAEIL